jgi:hypothetical protein
MTQIILMFAVVFSALDAAAMQSRSHASPDPMTRWLEERMEALAPVERVVAVPPLPGWVETAEQRRARYHGIATAIVEAVVDPAAQLPYRGPRARERSAALLLAIAYKETMFAPDADLGPCYRGPRHRARCGGGTSASVWQIELGRGRTEEGWTQADLFADRRKAVRVALRLARQSFGACHRNPPLARLNAFVSGSCDRGHEVSAARLRVADRIGVMSAASATVQVASNP